MKPGGGKAKGKGFESQVAKLLSKELAPLNFRRTESSGAIVGGKNFETIGQMFGADALKLFVGDIAPVNEREAGVTFKHALECKFYKTPDTFPQLVAGKANIFGWMDEIEKDCVKVDRKPLLIFKWNNTPIFAATSVSRWSSVTALPENGVALTLVSNGRLIYVYYLEDLLKIKEFWFDRVESVNAE